MTPHRPPPPPRPLGRRTSPRDTACQDYACRARQRGGFKVRWRSNDGGAMTPICGAPSDADIGDLDGYFAARA